MLATTPEWRTAAIRARKAKQLTQQQLGEQVGTAQNIISLIESGRIEASSFVLQICRVLGIAPPQHYGDEGQKRWAELGWKLRNRKPKAFERMLELLTVMLEDDGQRHLGNLV